MLAASRPPDDLAPADAPALDLQISLFEGGLKDTRPVGRSLAWPRLVELLSELRPHKGGLKQDRERAPLWSPAIYPWRGRRCIEDVQSVSCLVLDYDSGRTIENTLERWSGKRLLVHTSWRHRPDFHRYRLVLPLARPVPASDWPALFAHVWTEDGEAADKQCQDASRFFFLHTVGMGGPHRVVVQDGEVLDLVPLAADLVLQAGREERAREARRRRQGQGRPRQGINSLSVAERQLRRMLATDSTARHRAGEMLGGQIVERSTGTVVHRVQCPDCGRPSVWWPLKPDRYVSAMCEHRNSCGWMGSILDLAQGLGLHLPGETP